MKPKTRRLFQNRKKAARSGEIALQITSMADIFTILLVFLLKGIASDALAVTPSSTTHLPAGINSNPLNETALQVELSEKGILIEKDFITGYENFEKPLAERLTKEHEKHLLIAKQNDSVTGDSRVLLLSDQNIPFLTLKSVLTSLSKAGYSDVNFGVIRE
jgi:biopolymer transport protein ExbD